jgi:aconitase B
MSEEYDLFIKQMIEEGMSKLNDLDRRLTALEEWVEKVADLEIRLVTLENMLEADGR